MSETQPSPATEPVRRRKYDSPIGSLELVASKTGLRAVLLPHERADRIRLPQSVAEGKDAEQADQHLSQASDELDEYFAGKRTEFSVALCPVGTEFQLRAWTALRDIPYGATQSYGAQAKAMNQPSAVRAVGAANGKNPLSIIVPCHRVVGADGSLTGYAGGTDAKRFLLTFEQASAERS